MHGVLDVCGLQPPPLVVEEMQAAHQPGAQHVRVSAREDVPDGPCLPVPAATLEHELPMLLQCWPTMGSHCRLVNALLPRQVAGVSKRERVAREESR